MFLALNVNHAASKKTAVRLSCFHPALNPSHETFPVLCLPSFLYGTVEVDIFNTAFGDFFSNAYLLWKGIANELSTLITQILKKQ